MVMLGFYMDVRDLNLGLPAVIVSFNCFNHPLGLNIV